MAFMKRRSLSLFIGAPILALALLCGAQSAAAQQQPTTATLLAVVTDAESGAPLGNVTISIPSLSMGTLTTPVGQARLAGIPAGEHRVEVKQVGYQTQIFDLTFEPGAVRRIDAEMPVAPIALERVEATARRQVPKLSEVGFYQRERFGLGKFMDRNELRRRGAHDGSGMQSILRGIPGLQIQRVLGRRGHQAVNRRAGRACPVAIMIDGAHLGGGTVVLEEVVQGRDLEAIEFYRGPSEVPMELGGPRRDCGMLVIWTQDGR